MPSQLYELQEDCTTEDKELLFIVRSKVTTLSQPEILVKTLS